MDEQRYKLKKDIARRIKALHLIFICVVAYFLVHAICFIFLDKDMKQDFNKLRKDFLLDSIEITAHRGSIYSRNNEVLATSISRTRVHIDFACDRFKMLGPKKYQKRAKVLAQTLADCLGDKSASEYYEILIENNHKSLEYFKKQKTKTTKRFIFFKKTEDTEIDTARVRKGALRYEQIFRDLDANEWAIIKNDSLLRFGSTYRSKSYESRIYPQGDLARRTIGRREEHRTYGVEFAYRDSLAGRNGLQRVQRITNKLKIRVADSINVEARDGYDIITTLDVDIQDVTHTALSKQLLKENAIWGTTVVMECATGDILAMANLKNNGTKCVEVQNYAIGVPVNPGSTFKLVSAMALLEYGVPISQTYHTELGREVTIGTNTDAGVKDSHPIGEDSGGYINMRTAFAESSNVYFTKAVYERFKNNPIDFSNFCHRLHLSEKVGLEEFGATFKPIDSLNRKHQSRYNALVNMAYGYAVEVTPLHTLALYNAVANNGRMVAPRLILRTEHNGKVVSESQVRVIDEQICSPSTIKTLRSFMAETSRAGTAKNFFGEHVCPFSSGSKTGTAQVESVINDVKYKRDDGYYYGSMVTYFPADNPRYTIITAIFTKKQSGKQYYGAGLTGPVQKHVATYLYNRNHNYAQEVTSARYTATDIKGGNIENIETVANAHGIALSTCVREGWGANSISNNGKSITVSPLDLNSGVVPNVIGMGLSDALFILEKCGLEVTIEGQGKVVSQSLEPMSAISSRRKRITIKLK